MSESSRQHLPRAHLPRLLSLQDAAIYCSLSVATFSALCPVRPISLGKSKRLQRYDVVALDSWIDRIGGDQQHGRDWLAAMDGNNDSGTR